MRACIISLKNVSVCIRDLCGNKMFIQNRRGAAALSFWEYNQVFVFDITYMQLRVVIIIYFRKGFNYVAR